MEDGRRKEPRTFLLPSSVFRLSVTLPRDDAARPWIGRAVLRAAVREFGLYPVIAVLSLIQVLPRALVVRLVALRVEPRRAERIGDRFADLVARHDRQDVGHRLP